MNTVLRWDTTKNRSLLLISDGAGPQLTQPIAASQVSEGVLIQPPGPAPAPPDVIVQPPVTSTVPVPPNTYWWIWWTLPRTYAGVLGADMIAKAIPITGKVVINDGADPGVHPGWDGCQDVMGGGDSTRLVQLYDANMKPLGGGYKAWNGQENTDAARTTRFTDGNWTGFVDLQLLHPEWNYRDVTIHTASPVEDLSGNGTPCRVR